MRLGALDDSLGMPPSRSPVPGPSVRWTSAAFEAELRDWVDGRARRARRRARGARAGAPAAVVDGLARRRASDGVDLLGQAELPAPVVRGGAARRARRPRPDRVVPVAAADLEPRPAPRARPGAGLRRDRRRRRPRRLVPGRRRGDAPPARARRARGPSSSRAGVTTHAPDGVGGLRRGAGSPRYGPARRTTRGAWPTTWRSRLRGAAARRSTAWVERASTPSACAENLVHNDLHANNVFATPARDALLRLRRRRARPPAVGALRPAQRAARTASRRRPDDLG